MHEQQAAAIVGAVNTGLSVMHRPPPQRLSEWADENFYLSPESSYVEGRWETERFQRGLMDCMSNDEIEVIDFQKSARVGYSQMIRAAMGYFAEHKKRNQLCMLPSDQPAKEFMSKQVNTMIRDVPAVKALAPWYDKKHPDNTERSKTFSNGRVLHCRGGAAAKNYRELSVDVVIYDELDGFDGDIEQEGSPIVLGDKRNEGSIFPKSIRGTTPKLEKTSLIKQCVESADMMFRFHVPCPHCQERQALEFGGKKVKHGFKWDDDKPETVRYVCRHCGALSTYAEMQVAQRSPAARWETENGIWIDDDCYFRDGGDGDRIIETPRHVAFHIWTAYSPWTTWTKIVRDWLDAQGDITLLRTFVNTTLGEWWSDKGERANEDELMQRAYPFPVDPLPEGVAVLTCGVDTQPNRLEAQVVGWGVGEERWVIDKQVFMGDPNQATVWAALDAYLSRIYTRADGVQIRIARTCVDSGGANTKAVYNYCRTRFAAGVLCIKGMDGEGRPIIGNPTKLVNEGVQLYGVGTLTTKDAIFGALKIPDPGPGYIHFRSEVCDEDYFNQLTAEELKLKLVGGVTRRIYEKITSGRRNEALDTMQYAFAAFYSMNIRVEELVVAEPQQGRRVRGEMQAA